MDKDRRTHHLLRHSTSQIQWPKRVALLIILALLSYFINGLLILYRTIALCFYNIRCCFFCLRQILNFCYFFVLLNNKVWAGGPANGEGERNGLCCFTFFAASLLHLSPPSLLLHWRLANSGTRGRGGRHFIQAKVKIVNFILILIFEYY